MIKKILMIILILLEKNIEKKKLNKKKKRNLEFMIMITTRKMEMLEVFQEIKF